MNSPLTLTSELTANTKLAVNWQRASIFPYFLLLTFFFILVEISFFIQVNQAYLADFSFVSHQLPLPSAIIPSILFFVLAQCILHVAYCCLPWLITVAIGYQFKLSQKAQLITGISIWILGIITILIANQFYFPNSKFAELTSLIFPNGLLIFLISICCMLSLFALLVLFINYKWLISCVITAALLYFYIAPKPIIPQDAATTTQPNIILIGIDSLRPDFLNYFGQAIKTPFINHFLSNATIFSEAVTPLARTFPAWTSILTGEYPKQIGIRSNLADHHNINFSSSLPHLLHAKGYQTIYATDETRFSNIDQSYGFDQTITPPVGLNDFLLGTFNDFPISNLLVNTFIGKWLFPYSYANRPVNFLYQPNSFLNLLKPHLEVARTQPWLLIVHFCLPHHPFLWADYAAKNTSGQERYAASIERVDQQLAEFYQLLKQSQLLNHAIVVLLSDHGEGMELPGDRITEKELFVSDQKKLAPHFYPPTLDDEAMNQSAGHGTDVLALSQYHTLLAFRLYGLGHQQVASIPGRVALTEIKNTLLGLLNVDNTTSTLAQIIKDEAKTVPTHPIFLESDYAPSSIRTIYPETRQVMLEGIKLFQINPITTRLTVKPDMAEMIIHSKQLAILKGDWMLALYPQAKDQRMPILINLITGEWTNELNSTLANTANAQELLTELVQFYGDELTNNRLVTKANAQIIPTRA